MPRRWVCLLLMFATLLAACGGGGGGSPASPPPVVALTISSISPLSAPPGAILAVSGSGFGRVTAVRLGGTSASFNVVSDTSLSLVVPAAAVSGVLELSGNGSAVQSSQTVTVEAPTVTSVEPASVPAGGRVSLRGRFLDKVASVRLATVSLPVVSKAADLLQLDIPANALTGFPVLVAGDGSERQSAMAITVVQPLAVSSLSPAAGIVGSTVSLQGNGLDRVGQVFFGSVAAVPASQQNNQLTVLVPAGAASGPLRLVAGTDQLTTVQSFRVAPTMLVTGMTPTTGRAGTVVSISGSGLDEATGLTLAGIPLALASQSASLLRFAVPTGTDGGEVRLLASSQPSVSAGNFSVLATPATVARIDFVQTYSQQANDAYQRLLPGKPALVRAYVTGSGNSPGVTLVVRNGNTVVASLPMMGPSTLPASQQPYSLAQTFNATLTASQVLSGLNVSVQLNQPGGGSLDATPVMGSATNLKLVLVPLQTGSSSALLPATDAVRQAVLRSLPFADAAVQITTRASYSVSAVSAPPLNDSEWGKILDELDNLRLSEAPDKHYYGFVPKPSLSGAQTVGLGYQNDLNSRDIAAIGLDARYGDWQGTMLHELGHNFSRAHAPCGSPGDPDPAYPYGNGLLGSAALYDSTSSQLSDPTGLTDLMGYCGGRWFSDYNYRGAQTWLERHPYPLLAGAAQEADLLLVSGHIAGDTVYFAPLQARRGQPELAGSGSYQLRLTLADGTVREQPLRIKPIPDGAAQGFRLALPYPGPLARLDVLRNGQPLRQPVPAAARQVGNTVGAAALNWHEAAGELQLSWDASRYPRLTVTHLGRQRSLLATDLTGGQARLSLDGLPAGGRFEFSLGRALDARLLLVNR